MAQVPRVHYFDIYGRSEFLKALLEDKKAKYEFVPYNFGEHKTRNPELFAFGQLPGYEEGDLHLVQAPTIIRYLAKKHGLYPADIQEAARAEMTVDGVFDLFNKVVASLTTQSPSKEELVDNILPTWYGYFENILKKQGSGWVTSEFCFADVMLYQLVSFVNHSFPGSADKFPLLSALYQKVAARPNIAAYAKNGRRPQGWLEKRGAVRKNWKRRYFELTDRGLTYSIQPNDATPKGIIDLRGATILDSAPAGYDAVAKQYPLLFVVSTPGRDWFLVPHNELEKKNWVEGLRNYVSGK